jgi:hypothetical protein
MQRKHQSSQPLRVQKRKMAIKEAELVERGREKGKGKGGESTKGTGRGTPFEGSTHEQIYQWFGDVPW